MKLLEHEAKAILARYRVPVPGGQVVSADDAPKLPVVLKAQVPVGGRGKAGGIRLVTGRDEYTEAMRDISQLSIGGHVPSSIYAEESLGIARELYLSLVINRDLGAVELLAHPLGGVDIEEQDEAQLYRQPVTRETVNSMAQSLADHLDIPSQYLALGDLVENLYRCFTEQDATLLEINPLALTDDGVLVAADCKMELDDAAAYRHPEWDFSQKAADANFVTLSPSGTVATMANGAGLAMATVDAVVSAGHSPANFLDIGGAATVDSVSESFRRMSEFTNVQTVIVNIFGGIVRCDTVAEAIIASKDALPPRIKLAVRLSGNRANEADAILSEHGITHHSSLEAILTEIAA